MEQKTSKSIELQSISSQYAMLFMIRLVTYMYMILLYHTVMLTTGNFANG